MKIVATTKKDDKRFLVNEFFEEPCNESQFDNKMEFLHGNLSWMEAVVAETRVLVCESNNKNSPLFGQMAFTDTSCEVTSFVDRLENVAPISDLEAAEQCYKTSNRFVVLKNADNEMKVIPTFHTAQLGLLTRRGCNCPAIMGNSFISRPAASMEESFLNDSARRCRAKEQWGIIDGGAIANTSEGYVPLDAYFGYEVFKKTVKGEWPEATYVSGSVSYSFYEAEWDINDEVAVDGLKCLLEEYGVKVESLRALVRYSTSDTTSAQMGATMYYMLNGNRIRLAKTIGVDHRGDASIGKYAEVISDIGMLLKESEDAVERLGNTEIQYPAGCLSNVLGRCHLLNKYGTKYVDEWVVKAPTEVTALDIIIKVNEVLQEQAKYEDWSAERIVDASEVVSRMLNRKFSDYDKPLKLA